MMTAPTAAMATPPLSLLAFLGDVAIFTLVALATERAEAEFAIAGAAISDDAIRPAISNFKRMSNIPFAKQVGRRYHSHFDHARKLDCERMGSSQKTPSMPRLLDRTRLGQGKTVSVRVDTEGGSPLQTEKTNNQN